MSTKKDSLDDALAASFASPPKKSTKVAKTTGNKSKVEKEAGSLKKDHSSSKEEEKTVRPVAEKPKSVGTVKKTTISLYPHELDIVDRILDQLYHKGRVRGGLTDAVRVALKLCSDDPEKVYRAWEESKQHDGRIVRHQK